MSCVKRKKRRSLADVVFFRQALIQYWRNYRFYLDSKACFREDYESSCESFLFYSSLNSYLQFRYKIRRLINKTFSDEYISFRKDCLNRIKKLKKRGKAKLLRGHLFDDEN